MSDSDQQLSSATGKCKVSASKKTRNMHVRSDKCMFTEKTTISQRKLTCLQRKMDYASSPHQTRSEARGLDVRGVRRRGHGGVDRGGGSGGWPERYGRPSRPWRSEAADCKNEKTSAKFAIVSQGVEGSFSAVSKPKSMKLGAKINAKLTQKINRKKSESKFEKFPQND